MTLTKHTGPVNSEEGASESRATDNTTLHSTAAAASKELLRPGCG